MTAQASLDAQLESGNSPFADFTQFPESVADVRNIQSLSKNECSEILFLKRYFIFVGITQPA